MPYYKFRRLEITSKKEIEEVIKKAEEEWLKAIIATLYLYGCRISEALKLKRKDVWFDGNFLYLSIPLLKKRRRKAMVYEERHVLKIYKNAPFIDVILKYIKDKDPEFLLFPYTRQWVWKKIKKLKKNLSPHIFRHDRLTKLAMLGASEYVLVDWAGWSDSRPAQAYVRKTGRMAATFADKIE